ncbi:MAG: hypothetical protein H6757_04570 [Candidatus Omnitrophica bacterium]|nr:hypothetical protein [Candidatus Omnitrophota bacterium]
MDLSVDADKDLLRQKAVESAKDFKSSWIRLGQFLFTIQKDKLYKAWGFLSFETYCVKEISVKQTTASKLLKSYQFLEKEEPRFVDDAYVKTEASSELPNYESVNLLRLAKHNDKLTPGNLNELRTAVLDKAKEPKEVRAQVKRMIEENDTRDEDEIVQEIKRTKIKRLSTLLKSAYQDMSKEKVVPKYLLDQILDLQKKLEDQLDG